MINDPIVSEIRQIRQAYAATFNNDLHAICEDLRHQERQSGRVFRTPAREGEESRPCAPTGTRAGVPTHDGRETSG
jgi:hypothetical protein